MRMTKEQRDAVRSEIAALQKTFPPKRVPQRIIEGDQVAAAKWKYQVAHPPYHMTNSPGDSCSGRELIEIRNRLANFLTIN